MKPQHIELGRRLRTRLKVLRPLIPSALLVPYFRRRLARYESPTDEIHSIDAGPNLRFEMFWATNPNGYSGPRCRVLAHDTEVWRIDAIEGSPHLHFNWVDRRVAHSRLDNRVTFPASDPASDVRALLDFARRNFEAPLALNRYRKVRYLEYDKDLVAQALDEVERLQLDMIARHRSS